MGNIFDPWKSERERLALWIPVLFGMGIGGYFALPFEPPVWSTAPVLVLAGGMLWFARRQALKAVFVASVTLVVAVGFIAAQWRTMSVSTEMLQSRGGPTMVSGEVSSVETFSDGQRITIGHLHINALARHEAPKHIRLRLKGRQPHISPGDWVRGRAIVSPPSPPAMPGAFDFQRHSYFQAVGGVGFSIGQMSITAEAEHAKSVSLAFWIARFRQHMTERIIDALPGEQGGVAAALITGERRAIAPEIVDAMRDSGLAHLLSISGLHIGLVAGLLFAAIRAATALVPTLALRFPTKKWAAIGGLAGAFSYAVIAGATLPTQRAFLMLSIALLGVLLDRRGLSMRAVAWAALVVLAVQPESLLSASFQMSFAAVTALVAVYEGYSMRRPHEHHRDRPPWRRVTNHLLLYLSGVLLTTFVAGTATAPFAIFHFNRFADFGLVANLLGVPLTALWVMPWAIVSMLLMPIGGEQLGLVPMGWGIAGVVEVAKTVSSWPGAVALMPAMPVWSLAVVSLGGLWMSIWQGRARYAGIGAMAAGLIPLVITSHPNILIDARGRITAIHSADNQLVVSHGRRNAFERDIWARRLASNAEPLVWPASGPALAGRLQCDIAGCLYVHNGKKVALVRHERALAEDCWQADAVISPLPVRGRCPAAVVVDRFDLWRRGAHAVWLEKDKIRVESVNEQRGKRPWTVQPDDSRPKRPLGSPLGRLGSH
ncbi:MAG: DUF4131 domain-containing protein [Rhodospirillaceae bacterium]|nr:DUF4131 domain-containing protein [Rhodospirillaceae bacterium]